MKTNLGFWRRLGLIFLAVILLGAIYALSTVMSLTGARRAVEETRAALRQQGFKTDLADFDFTVPSDQRGFELSINGAGFLPRGQPFLPPTLLVPAGSNSAIIVWNEDFIKCESEDVPWADFAASVSAEEQQFLAARDEALAHPIRFSLEANRGSAMLLPHLSGMRRASFAFSSGMIVDLHDRDADDAWTNLLAVTRLVSAWEPEDSEISHFVRFALASIAYETTWQALQTNGWSDAQLAELAREWGAVDFFKNLPESIAFQRACVVDVCRRDRNEPSSATITDLLKDMLHSPGYAPQMVKGYWSQLRYRSEGTYVDEKDVLLFYRDREVEVRQALQAPTWAAMRSMAGVTNQVLFKSKYPSRRMQSFLDMRGITMAMNRAGGGLLGRAAEAESRRRLVLTAIALERFRIRHGKYPASLRELVPDFLKTPATDFIDGQPLRYQLGDDGRFVLYSIGLDCVDNGGEIPRRAFANGSSRGMGFIGGAGASGDLVWPRPASGEEIAALHEQELEARQQQMDQVTEMESEQYWDRTARRQGSVEKILAAPPTLTRDLNYNGRPLSEILRNQNASGTNTLTLAEMLSLHQVITGAEPETVTFEAPISYDALTNVGSLALYIDPVDDDSDEGSGVGQMECSRATNGDCLLAWNTIFETPGKHALMMGVELNDPAKAKEEIIGPSSAVVVSNLCQFSLASATFDIATGASLRARLPEMRGEYSIDMLTAKGERVKTISGSTSNGYINVFWDLMDEHGRKLGEESFDTVFHITLPQSGRSQTLRGP